MAHTFNRAAIMQQAHRAMKFEMPLLIERDGFRARFAIQLRRAWASHKQQARFAQDEIERAAYRAETASLPTATIDQINALQIEAMRLDAKRFPTAEERKERRRLVSKAFDIRSAALAA